MRVESEREKMDPGAREEMSHFLNKSNFDRNK